MEYVNIHPSVFAQLKGLNREEFCQACLRGQEKYGDFPVGEWVVRKGEAVSHLRVPYTAMSRHIENGEIEVRNNPVDAQENLGDPNWAETIQNTAVPVTGQVSAAGVLIRWADVVEEHPGLGADVIDMVAGLGMAGMGLAATEPDDDLRWLKVLGSGIGGFAAMRFGRNAMDQQGSDRIERAQQKRLEEGQSQKEEEQTKLSGKGNREELPPQRGDGSLQGVATLGSHAR